MLSLEEDLPGGKSDTSSAGGCRDRDGSLVRSVRSGSRVDSACATNGGVELPEYKPIGSQAIGLVTPNKLDSAGFLYVR